MPPATGIGRKNMASIIQYKTKDGKKYYKFQLYVGTDPLTGKRIKTTRSKFKTKKEAQLALSRLQLEIEQNGFKKKTCETYQDVYDLWLEQYRNTVKESTLVKTVGIFRNHILPVFGKYRIEKVSVLDCQKHVNEWFKKLKRYRMTYTYAAKVFDYAMTLGLIQKNPMKLITMPVSLEQPEEEKKLQFYTKEQLVQLLEYAKKENNFKAYTLFRLLAFSGLRKGEALALTWNDINFKENTISVNKALTRGENARLIVQAPKTKKSFRTLNMDENTMFILKEWRKKQKSDLLKLGYNSLKSKQLVFSSTKNEFLQPSKTRKWLLHIQNKYGLEKITTHGFRHTHCSLLFEAGATIKEVQDRLGHSDVKTTMNIYAHVTEKAKEKTAKKFATYMNY